MDFATLSFRFTFGGHERWQLFFDSPNAAGCFLATFLPAAWVWRRAALAGGWRIWHLPASAAGEALIWFLMAKTMSRGALAGAVAAFVLFSIGGFFHRRTNTRQRWLELAIPVVFMLTAVLLTGFSKRLEMAYSFNDRSAINRLDVWQGALQMVAAAPVRGWGDASSGWSNTQWFRDGAARDGAGNLLSTPLEIAAREGLPGLFLCLAPFTIIGVLGTRRTWLHTAPVNGWRVLSLELAIASNAAFLVASSFSTFFDSRLILPVAAINAAAFVSALAGRIELLQIGRDTFLGVFIAMVICGGVYLLGRRLAEPGLEIRNHSGVVTLQTQSTSHSNRVIFPDRTVLGSDYGRSLRQAIVREKLGGRFAVITPGGSPTPELLERSDRLILSGRFAEEVHLGSVGHVLIIHPTTLPPEKPFPQVKRLIVPSYDRTFATEAWVRWADAGGCEVIRSRFGSILQESDWRLIGDFVP